MTARRAWALCAVAGVLAFVASYLFGRIPDLRPCGLTESGTGAIMAFEFAHAPAALAVLFGTDPCRTALVAAQRTGLLLDGLWFIPAYTAFLMLAARATGAAWWRWVAGALLVAGLSDEIEGVLLWSILNSIAPVRAGGDALWAALEATPDLPARLSGLWIAVHLKFALLALGTAGIGVLAMAGSRRVLPRIVGIALIVFGGFAAIRLAQGDVAGMMLAFAIGWIALLASALTFSLWPSLFAGAAVPPPDPAGPAA